MTLLAGRRCFFLNSLDHVAKARLLLNKKLCHSAHVNAYTALAQVSVGSIILRMLSL